MGIPDLSDDELTALILLEANEALTGEVDGTIKKYITGATFKPHWAPPLEIYVKSNGPLNLESCVGSVITDLQAQGRFQSIDPIYKKYPGAYEREVIIGITKSYISARHRKLTVSQN